MQQNSKKPDPLDVALGARIRARRNAAGVTQTQLAHALGVTFQQIQKYENGLNRLSFGRTVRIAGVLKTTVADLTAGLVDTPALAATSRRDALLADPEAHEMLAAFGKLKNRKARASLLELARLLHGGVTVA